MKAKIKYYSLTFLGAAISTIPVMTAALSYFPLWHARGADAVLSGFTLLLLLVASAPLFRLLKRALASPSIQFTWLIIFVTFFVLRNIADEMTVIAFVGFVSNSLGAVIFKLAKRGDARV